MLQLASTLLLAGGARAAAHSRRLRQSMATIGQMEGTLTAETAEFDLETPPECTKVMTGCTGTFTNGEQQNVGGTVEVIDDCTFRVQDWTFTGDGPAVEWWAAEASGDPTEFPYETAAGVTSMKVGEIGEPGSYVAGSDAGGSGDITVRIGQDQTTGEQILLSPELNHISLWCVDFEIDFGNVLLDCPAGAPGSAPAAADGPTDAALEDDTATDDEAGEEEEDADTTDVGDDDPGSSSDSDPAPQGESGGEDAPEEETDAAHHAAGTIAAVAASVLLAVAL